MLNNKQGAGYIQACVMILVLCMILAACLTFAATANTIRVVERNVRIVQDSFVMENSIVIYDSIKNGHDFTESVDINDYRTKLISYNTLTASGNDLYHYTADGSWDYRITKPTLSMTESHTLKIAAHYTITIPLYFAGTQVTTVSVPMTVESKWTDKF